MATRYRPPPPPTTYRYPWFWPFSADSAFNLGMGSNAVYGPTDDNVWSAFTKYAGSTSQIAINNAGNPYDYPCYVAVSTDPFWYCAGDSYGPASSIHIPAGGITSAGSDAVLQVFDQSLPTQYYGWDNGETIEPGAVTINGVYYSGGQIIPNQFGHRWDTRGNGLPYYNNGACSTPGYSMRDFNAGTLRRLLPCSLNTPQTYNWNGSQDGYSPNAVYPGCYSDYKVNEVGYNSNEGVPYGSIIYVPQAVFNIAELGYSPGSYEYMVAYQAQNHGFFVNNTAGLDSSNGLFLVYTDQTISSGSTANNAIQTVLNQLVSYFRIHGSWMYAPGKYGLLAPQTKPPYAPGAGYQYSPTYNSAAPINGGGTYPTAANPVPDFYPSVGIGNGRTFNTSGVQNGPDGALAI